MLIKCCYELLQSLKYQFQTMYLTSILCVIFYIYLHRPFYHIMVFLWDQHITGSLNMWHLTVYTVLNYTILLNQKLHTNSDVFAVAAVEISVALPGFSIPIYKCFFFFPQNKIVRLWALRAVVALNWRHITTEDLT